LGWFQQLPSLHFTQLSSKNGLFELFCRFGAPGQGRLGININRHADAMPALIGCDLGSTPASWPREAWVLRKTWNVAHCSPTFFSRGSKCLLHRLSLHNGVDGFSEANTHAFGLSGTSSIHSFRLAAVLGGMATVRAELAVFGVSMSPR
jgi:hypothetical protein